MIVTLTLMILLTVIAVGLLTLSSISLRSVNQNSAMATAKSNARMALMLAIGDLQKSMGPDRAISANSEILAASPAKPQIAGAWESWDFDPSSTTLDYDSEKTNRFRRWLVSSPKPQDVESKDFGSTPWTGKTIEMVGNGSLGDNAPVASKVFAGRVPVSYKGKVTGGYAWHVADESVKARINLYRDGEQNTTFAQKRALLAGQRPDTSVMKDVSGNSLDFLPSDESPSEYKEAVTTTGKILSLDQAGLFKSSGGAASAPDKIKPFRNDVTPYSLGLLTDARKGGLKQDLSSLFELATSATVLNLPSDFQDKRLYDTTIGISGDSDPYWNALSGYYNTFRSITGADSNPTITAEPATSVSITTLTPPKGFSPGPVIAKIEGLFSYVTRDAHGNWVNTLKAVDPQMKYMGHLVYSPLVTLHNPYNVSLSFDSMEVTIRNMPVAFNFYVNNKPQSSKPVPLSDMFVYGTDRRGKDFVMDIANWTSPTATRTSGPIVMKPGQTLVCGPYLHPNASLSNDQGTPFFDWQNNATGTSTLAMRSKPGFVGRCMGFDVDWITPDHNGFNSGQSTDGNNGVLGLRGTDSIRIDYTVAQPSFGLTTAFQVTAKMKAGRRSVDYGGLDFKYNDAATLKRLFPTIYTYPERGGIAATAAYVTNTDPVSRHASAQTIAVFSAYARTTNGGVYNHGTRVPPASGAKILHDGRLSGMPFLYHNPARTVMSLDLRREKPGAQSHELNFQQFLNLGQVEDYFNLDTTNRTAAITGNTTTKGIKSGSYLELPTGPMQTIADFRRSNALTSSYLPNFVQPVSNSRVSPLMETGKVKTRDSNVASYDLLDQSVLANHALYDRFYFSTFATNGNVSPEMGFENFVNGTAPLLNQSFQPYLPTGETLAIAKGKLFSSSKPSATAYQKAAEYQMVRGAFNVNSTSVQAWKAMLATMNHGDIVTLWAKSAGLQVVASRGFPILPMSMLNGGIVGGAGGVDANKIDDLKTNDWNGHRELTDQELENLAGRIVEQVRLRGPFLSMSEFVNRRIGSDSELTRVGALEAAIDHSGVNTVGFNTQVPLVASDFSDASTYPFKTPLASVGNPAAGAPGWIMQGDLMRILEPAATVRSDSFVIRVCGEAQDASGAVTARAYAEAVVQRLPEYVDPVDDPSLNAAVDTSAAVANQVFGRRFSVVSFRWLNSNEI